MRGGVLALLALLALAMAPAAALGARAAGVVQRH